MAEPVWREPPEGWHPFGHHVDLPVRLEFSEETGDDLMPLWERPIPPDERHNHDPIGLYPNCRACGTVISQPG